jgi:hypothetical protein
MEAVDYPLCYPILSPFFLALGGNYLPQDPKMVSPMDGHAATWARMNTTLRVSELERVRLIDDNATGGAGPSFLHPTRSNP